MDKYEVNHKDGNKANNKLSNLEWVTHSENQIHAFSMNLQTQKGSNNSNSKLTESDVRKIKGELKQGEKVVDIAKRYGVCHQCISNIKNEKTWKEIV